jgi:AraC-like DNA-binding protein
VRKIADVYHVAGPGHILFFDPEVEYQIDHPDGRPDECLFLSFSRKALHSAFGVYGEDSGMDIHELFSVYWRLNRPDIQLLLRKLLYDLKGDPGEQLAIEDTALEIAARSLETAGHTPHPDLDHRRPETRSAHRTAVEKAKLFLDINHHRKISLQDIAADAAVSAYHLSRLFKNETGVSLYTYLTRSRLQHSMYELESGNTDLTQIALDHGFSSHAHFTWYFRRYFQITPSLYRKGRIDRRQLAKLARS